MSLANAQTQNLLDFSDISNEEMLKDNSALSEEKKPRRKSMLLCGRRRSKSLGGPSASSDLCNFIPFDESKENRLKQLLKMSYQHTLLSVCREFKDVPGFYMTHIIDMLSDHYDTIESHFEKDDMISRAVSDQPEMKQKEDIAIEKYVEGLNTLKNESEEWDNIIKEEEEKLTKCIKSPNELLLQDTNIDLNDAMSCDYNELLESTNAALNNFTLLANNVSNNSDVPFTVLNTDKYLEQVTSLASEYLAQNIQETPRTLFKNLKVVH